MVNADGSHESTCMCLVLEPLVLFLKIYQSKLLQQDMRKTLKESIYISFEVYGMYSIDIFLIGSNYVK